MEKFGMSAGEFRIDFIGIGAAKSGTTWLVDCLRAHPQIFMPERKELIYFNEYIQDPCEGRNHRRDKGLPWYHSHFADALPQQIKGEFSNHYLVDANAARRIYAYNPLIKLIAVLRNPVDRAFSRYRDNYQKQRTQHARFEDALRAEPLLLSEGLYHEQLRVYYEVFPRENIKVLLHDDLVRDARAFLQEVLKFLGVAEFYPEMLGRRSNEAREVRIPVLNQMITATRQFIYRYKMQWCLRLLEYMKITALAEYVRDSLNTRIPGAKPCVRESTRDELKAYFSRDVARLEELLGRDLSAWK